MWALIRVYLVTVGVFCAEVDFIDNSVTAVTSNSAGLGGQDNDLKLVDREKRNYVTTDPTVVTTDDGPVHGFVEDRIVRYFDIPYGSFNEANPFQEPSPPQSWTDTLANTEHTSRCPQIDSESNYIGNHNCLTLSIFVPEEATNADVLFHIHDSSSNIGSGDPSKYGPKYLAEQGIILVLPNYRIGPLGFLCLQNETLPGNAGLKDLHLALQWTKRNINMFGGNDSNIVVSGSGVAGALVEYLVLLNNSRSLISKAITESGFVLSPWALDRYPSDTMNSLVKEFEKSQSNASFYSSSNTDNLRNLVSAAQNLTFLPCVENENGLLTETPWHLLNNEKFEITVMSGSANQAAMDKAMGHTEESLSEINQNFSLLLPNDLKFNNIEEKNRIGNQVRAQYFGGNNITTDDMEMLSQCYSDSQYLYPGIRGARLLVKAGAVVYFYEFSYGSRQNFSGSIRGDTLNYVFDNNKTTTESGMNTTMLNLWASFIKSGKPSIEGIEWPTLKAVRESEEVWLSIGNNVTVNKNFHHNRLKLWDEIYQKHFVERNLALRLNPSMYITFLGTVFLLDISYDLKF